MRNIGLSMFYYTSGTEKSESLLALFEHSVLNAKRYSRSAQEIQKFASVIPSTVWCIVRYTMISQWRHRNFGLFKKFFNLVSKLLNREGSNSFGVDSDQKVLGNLLRTEQYTNTLVYPPSDSVAYNR